MEIPKNGQESTTTVDPPLSSSWEWGNFLDFEENFTLPWDSDERLASLVSLTPSEGTAEPSNQISESSDGSDRVRKRDPKLVCENFLAGRVPCACPELEDKEEETIGKKRSRTMAGGARCQVPGCGADITSLKGYHRRHRVCLRCANATSVVLDGQHKRYCQQCGKFHFLGDFDEGKRSCRRKLERHNNRRRRKSISLTSASEKESLGELPIEDITYDDETGKAMSNEVATTDNLTLSNQMVDTETLLESEDGRGSPSRSAPTFQNLHRDSVLSFVVSDDTQMDGGKENIKSTVSSIFNTKSAYSSVCPTGRISFKLYDWNPAEFPRRLRHQIFQWLASMPVELEGYIRPGCTILTLFVAMPQDMWDMVVENAPSYISRLVSAPESLLFGRGKIMTDLNDMTFNISKDGSTTQKAKMKERVPELHYVHPTCFEAGKQMEFVVCGSNLSQPKSRFLISFAENYLACDSYLAIPHGKIKSTNYSKDDFSVGSSHEMFKICVSQLDPHCSGPAFIEVENEAGLSNYISVFIADRQIISEIQTMQQKIVKSLHPKSIGHESCDATEDMDFYDASQFNDIDISTDSCNQVVSKQKVTSELLLDIAWLLKKSSMNEVDSNIKLQRFRHLLDFIKLNGFTLVLEKILHTNRISTNAESFNKNVENTPNYTNHVSEILEQDSQHFETSVSHSREMLHTVSSDNQETEILGNNSLESSTSTTHDNIESTPLIQKNKDLILNMNCHHSIINGIHWPQSTANGPIFSRRTRFTFLMAAAVATCCGLCIALRYPHKVLEFMTPIQRCMMFIRDPHPKNGI